MGRFLLIHGRLVLAENAELVLDFHLLNNVVSRLKNIRTNFVTAKEAATRAAIECVHSSVSGS